MGGLQYFTFFLVFGVSGEAIRGVGHYAYPRVEATGASGGRGFAVEFSFFDDLFGADGFFFVVILEWVRPTHRFDAQSDSFARDLVHYYCLRLGVVRFV